MRRKGLLYGLLLLLVPFVLAACGDSDEPVIENRKTVLVYMAADNNLSKFTIEDLAEMKAGMKTMDMTGLHLLVYIDTGSPRLIELQLKKGEVEENVIKEYEPRNSVGTAETQEVFNDVFGNARFQADSYGLVYWSHADGWIPNPLPTSRWIGQDTGDGTHYMNIEDFVSILQQAPHFDFIMFDACFMLSVEVAYELRNYTDYYIGSPTENPGPGAPYDRILPYMFQEGAADKIAAEYFAAYEEKYNGGSGISNSNWTGGTSICVLKSSELENLAAATRKALSGVTSVSNRWLSSEAFDYDQRWNSHVGYYDFVELMELMVTEETALTEWRQAFASARKYWSTTPKNYSQVVGMFSMERANGVTHYIPSATEDAAARAYRSTAWYSAVGLASIGW